MTRMIRMCLNWKVLAGLGLVAVGVGVYRPGLFGAALPILLLAACPLSMLAMMWSMRKGEHAGSTQSPTLPDDPAVLRARMTALAAEQEQVSERLAHLPTPPSSTDEGSRVASTPTSPV